MNLPKGVYPFTGSCRMGFRHLNYLQRCQILALWKAGFNQTQIAKEAGVHKSTICRELKRNLTFVRTSLGHWTYKPDYAQTYAKERRQATRYYYKFTVEVEAFVREKLLQEWSPEQISRYAKRWKLFSIGDETLVIIANKLNNRPRKTLGYKTPGEIFFGSDGEKLACYRIANAP